MNRVNQELFISAIFRPTWTLQQNVHYSWNFSGCIMINGTFHSIKVWDWDNRNYHLLCCDHETSDLQIKFMNLRYMCKDKKVSYILKSTHTHMWGDQAEWVVCREYWFLDTPNYWTEILLFLIVFSQTKSSISLEPQVQFWWGLQQKKAL